MKGNHPVYRHTMSGLSDFLPFIVAGYVLVSTALLMDPGNGLAQGSGIVAAISRWFLQNGELIIQVLMPLLAGSIALSVADRPGLLAGMVAGALARDAGSGFLGAVLGGFLAGYLIKLLQHITRKLPRSFEGMKILIIFPVVGTLMVGLAMMPVNRLAILVNSGVSFLLQNMPHGAAIFLGALIGAMLAYDCGGPINKIAYLFSVATLMDGSGRLVPSLAMGAAGCAGMTISTGCALATVLFPKKFSSSLKEAGKAAWILGLSFIGEGAIPFAEEHPREIRLSLTIGAAVAGALSAQFRLTLSTPIGGIFTIPFAGNILLYVLCFVIGTLISAFLMGFLLKEPVVDEKE